MTLKDELLNLQIGIELDKMYVKSYDHYPGNDAVAQQVAQLWGECNTMRLKQFEAIKKKFGLDKNPYKLLERAETCGVVYEGDDQEFQWECDGKPGHKSRHGADLGSRFEWD